MSRNEASAKRGGRRPRVQLDTEQIIDAAMAIADREGPDAATMRAIAAELGVGVMSLYWYVPNKRELEALMLDRIMQESSPPHDPSGDWRKDLASIARSSRTSFLKHRWLVDMLSSASFIPEQRISHGVMSHLENTMRMVDHLPLSFAEKMGITRLIDNFTMGFTLEEVMEQRRLEGLGMTEDELHAAIGPQMFALLDEGDYPLVRTFMAHDHELPDKDVQFEYGLQILLDGIELQLDRAKGEKK